MLLSLMSGPCLFMVMMGEAYMEPPLTHFSSHQTPRPPHAQALRKNLVIMPLLRLGSAFLPVFPERGPEPGTLRVLFPSV